MQSSVYDRRQSEHSSLKRARPWEPAEIAAEYSSLKQARTWESAEIATGLRRDFSESIAEWREHFDAPWKVWTPSNTFKFRGLDAAGRNSVFVIVSSRVEPDAVAKNVESAEDARRALGDLGNVIPAPLKAGLIGERTYTTFAYHRSFRFLRRPLGDLQKSMLGRRVLPWLRTATEKTAREPTTQERRACFVVPLERLRDDPFTPDETRTAAEAAWRRLETGAWRPRLAFMHDDLNSSNILKPTGIAAWGPPMIIDWERASIRGYGFYDLFGMTSWMPLSARRLRIELDRHCRILGHGPADIRSYLLAALGTKALALRNPLPEFIWREPHRIVHDDVMSLIPGDQRKTAVDVAGAISQLKRLDRLESSA